MADDPKTSPAGLPIATVYRPADAGVDYATDLGDPGEFPYTRGVQATMYRGRLWTMRQYAGFDLSAHAASAVKHANPTIQRMNTLL